MHGLSNTQYCTRGKEICRVFPTYACPADSSKPPHRTGAQQRPPRAWAGGRLATTEWGGRGGRATHRQEGDTSRCTCRSPALWRSTPPPHRRSDCLRTPAQAPTPFSSGTGPLARLQTLSRDGASAGCPIMHWAILIRARCPITLSPVSLSRKTVYISTHSVHTGNYWKTQQLTHVRYTNWSGIYGTRGEAFPELCQ